MNNEAMKNYIKNINYKSINNKFSHIRTKNLTNSNFLIKETTDFRNPQTNYKKYEKNFNLLKVNDNKYHKINNLKTNHKFSNNITYHSKISSTPLVNKQINNKFKNNNKLTKSKGFDNSLYKRQYLNYNDNYYL